MANAYYVMKYKIYCFDIKILKYKRIFTIVHMSVVSILYIGDSSNASAEMCGKVHQNPDRWRNCFLREAQLPKETKKPNGYFQ